MTVAASEIRNISAWRLNKTEMKELAERVEKGEDEAVVKKELQTKKAVACEERKKSAAAIFCQAWIHGPQGKQKDFVVACNSVSHGCCDSRPNECWLLRSGRSGPPDNFAGVPRH